MIVFVLVANGTGVRVLTVIMCIQIEPIKRSAVGSTTMNQSLGRSKGAGELDMRRDLRWDQAECWCRGKWVSQRGLGKRVPRRAEDRQRALEGGRSKRA